MGVLVRMALVCAAAQEIGNQATARAAPPSATDRRPELPPRRVEESVVLSRGQTLLEVLGTAGVDRRTALAAAKALADAFDPRRLRVGQSLTFSFNGSRRLVGIRLYPDHNTRIFVRRIGEHTFEALWDDTSYQVSLAGRIVTVGRDLAVTAQESDLPGEVLGAALLQLGHRIDLQRELRRGDRLRVVYREYRNGASEPAHPGELLHVAWMPRDGGEGISVYRFRDDAGGYGFYDRDGVSVEAALVKTPVRGGEVSSLFGPRRHPVLGYTRMHRGLDFAAPSGTPVVAAGDGRIVARRRLPGYGNYVRIRHRHGLETAYAHLSSFSAAFDTGDEVRQGQVIGYVGSTGLSTGPHLHFEVLQGGEQVDPQTLDLPPRRVLDEDERTAFIAVRRLLDHQLARSGTRDGETVAASGLSSD